MDLLHVIVFGAALGLTSGVGVLPDSLNAAVGDSVMFMTSQDPMQGPLMSIIWTFGTRLVINSVDNSTSPEYEDRISLFIDTGSLQLRNVTVSDTGEYNVTIIKRNSSEINGLTKLTVWETISETLVTSPTQLPREGISLNVTCDASGSISKREWMKNGSPLNDSENIEFYNQKEVLSFTSVSRKDSGRYSCSVSNPYSSQEANHSILVIYGPENVHISGPKEVQVQTHFKLSCSAEFVPVASYIWIKNGTTVADSFDFTKNSSDYSDSGEYICRVTNEFTLETSEASHTVNITEAPHSGLSPGAIAGITIGCLAAVVVLVVGGFLIYKYFTGKQPSTKSIERPTRPDTARESNFYTEDQPVYENAQQIYDRDL